MGHGKRQFCRLQGDLGCNAAGPEDGYFGVLYRYGRAKVRFAQISDAYLRRIPKVYGCAMN